MTISCNWLMDYLPVRLEPEKLALILNSIGLEVESVETFESVKGGLEGLIIGEVLSVVKHPNADKLSLTRVNTGNDTTLSIVCGAPNVAAGQKVVVAPVGSTIYPLKSEPLTMKAAKIRGELSEGMICAEDEIGVGESHEGIMVLPADLEPGTPAASWFKPYSDTVISIGLTPNRSDAMSHLGVARDICAWLNHHENQDYSVRYPEHDLPEVTENSLSVTVSVENTTDCLRYSGIGIAGITVKPSPDWMQNRLRAIGLRPINNIVDITNYILHETGQPLHAFDADKISGNRVIVKNLPTGTPFITLDGKERQLDGEDLMICDGEGKGMCIGGVFGGIASGVTENTRNIFLESAWFNPVSIRKTSFRHNLRTDAATHFEKGVDIGSTVRVLKRAAHLIAELGGGRIASPVTDVYPLPVQKKEITYTTAYLKKISGKEYPLAAVGRILHDLGFEIKTQDEKGMTVQVPLHKTDISLPADIAEEIMRIDGFDNILIPETISISPALETMEFSTTLKEKTANMLAAQGFNEMLNNSITNSAWYTEQELSTTVKMLNNLSAELNILRPSMLETGLQSIAHNLNRKNNNLRLFEFGKTYRIAGPGQYEETDHLVLFLTGKKADATWKTKPEESDFFFLKGILRFLASGAGLPEINFTAAANPALDFSVEGTINNTLVLKAGRVGTMSLNRFDIRQEVWYADILWENWLLESGKVNIRYREIPRFPAVQRDLAFVVDKSLDYGSIEKAARSLSIKKLKSVTLFDVFESEKIGSGKKSVAVSFTFQDEEKTLTDQETDLMMQKIITIFEKDLQAQIRR